MHFIGSLISGAFGLLFFIAWLLLVIYALMGVMRSVMNLNTKLLWIIIILIAPVLGSLIYLIWGRTQRL